MKIRKIEILVIIILFITEAALFFPVPLMSMMRKELQVDESSIQHVMSLYVVGMAISALFYGSLSDLIGRRKCIIISSFITNLATLCCVMSETFTALVFARFLQGIGLGASWTICNAMLKDSMSDKQFAKSIVFVHMISGLFGMIMPPISSFLGTIIGWRGVFFVLLLCCIIVFLICFLYLKETLKHISGFSIKSMGVIFNSYVRILKNKKFVCYLAIKVLMVSVFFTDVANFPLIMIEGYSCPMLYFGILVALGDAFYVIGCAVNNNIASKIGITNTLIAGMVLTALSMIMLMLLNGLVTDPLYLQLLRIPMYLGAGWVFGNSTYLVLSVHPKNTGSASAIMIALEMVVGSCAIYGISKCYDKTFVPVSLYVITCTIICYVLLRFSHVSKKRKG